MAPGLAILATLLLALQVSLAEPSAGLRPQPETSDLRSKSNGDDSIDVAGDYRREHHSPRIHHRGERRAAPVAISERYCPPTLYTYGVEREVITECDGAGGTELVPWRERVEGEDGELPEGVTAQPVVVTRSDVQSLLVHSGSLEIQPDRSWVLVNAETIAMTDAQEHLLGTQVLGLDVDVRVAPALFSWDFGEGTDPIVGTDPGAPWPDHTVAYTYRSEGEATITLRTEWDAAFRVAGTSAWVPVEGRAVTVTTSEPIDVVSASPRLTAGS